LLDDDPDYLDSFAEMIVFLSGRAVLKACCVSELAELGDRALACSLAILDINLGLGQPSGIDALEWLRSRSFLGRIIFLTAHAPGLPIIEHSHTQSVPVLSKPLSIDELRALLSGCP
jgi:DNA-binding response OmpR family regulator